MRYRATSKEARCARILKYHPTRLVPRLVSPPIPGGELFAGDALVNLDIAASKRAALCGQTRNRNAERVCGTRLAVVGHLDREGARRSITDARSGKRSCGFANRERAECHAAHFGPSRVVHVLQVALDLFICGRAL